MLFGTPSLLSFQFFVIVFYTCIYIQPGSSLIPRPILSCSRATFSIPKGGNRPGDKASQEKIDTAHVSVDDDFDSWHRCRCIVQSSGCESVTSYGISEAKLDSGFTGRRFFSSSNQSVV